MRGCRVPFPTAKPIGPIRRCCETEFHEFVAERVSALPPRQREVLVLMTYEDLTAAETA